MEMGKDFLKTAFKERAHRYLYSKDSSDESEEIYEPEVGTDVTSFDPRDKLFERHEEFIKRQLAVVKRIQLKGILTVSSKQSVEEPLTISESDRLDDGCLVEKEDKVPQTRKNRKRKLKKKRRREQQLITKKLKEETASDLGGDVVDNVPGPGVTVYGTSSDIVDNTAGDMNDSTLSGTGDSIGKVLGYGMLGYMPGDTDDSIPSNTGDFIDNTPSDRPT